ncbi:hypothetical protein B0H10DRAFT_1813275 [Mycena sp. CBHHK59/15]|nr:hypothetical protein B0H10DRAFT_1813275 [Mycena sp. CBHHK59/15]
MLHPASLVDSGSHSRELMDLINLKLSKHMIGYIVQCVGDAVEYAIQQPLPLKSRRMTNFEALVSRVLHSAEVEIATVLVTVAYVTRAKEHLQITLEHWALERLFLGALVVASKYLNDSTMKNVHWALCTGIFKTPDIGVMEREFLEVLDFELGVKEHHILFHHGSIMGRLLVDAGWCGQGNKRSGEDINQCPPKRSKMT